VNTRTILAAIGATGAACTIWAGSVGTMSTQVADTLPTISLLVGAAGAALTGWVLTFKGLMYERTPLGGDDRGADPGG
jgi:hypothetical protein